MAPQHKTSHKAHASSHYYQPSDLDSDYPTHQASYSQDFTAALNQPPPQRSTNDLNLAVLQKHYPTINSILSTAPYSVIYYFSGTSQTWEKSGVEGTLFIVNLYSALGLERYALIVLNRRGLENWFVEIKKEDEVEVTNEYIILQGRSGSQGPVDEYEDASTIPEDEMEIYGLWIFSEETGSTKDMRSLNAQLIQDCAVRAHVSRDAVEQRRTELLQRQGNERGGFNTMGHSDARFGAGYAQSPPFQQQHPQQQQQQQHQRDQHVYQEQRPPQPTFGPIGGMPSGPHYYPQPNLNMGPPPFNGHPQNPGPWQAAPSQQQMSLTDMLTRSVSSPHAQPYGYPPQHMGPPNGHHNENANPNILGDLFQRAASNYRGP